MIARCKCGRMKTVHPYSNAAEKSWICEVCSEGERNRRRDQRTARQAETNGVAK